MVCFLGAKPLPVLSCFSGVGGLELGVRQPDAYGLNYIICRSFCVSSLMADGSGFAMPKLMSRPLEIYIGDI